LQSHAAFSGRLAPNVKQLRSDRVRMLYDYHWTYHGKIEVLVKDMRW
jgi:hypothetical protein